LFTGAARMRGTSAGAVLREVVEEQASMVVDGGAKMVRYAYR